MVFRSVDGTDLGVVMFRYAASNYTEKAKHLPRPVMLNSKRDDKRDRAQVLFDIDNEPYCCTKKAIKMNTHHQQGGHMLSQINYYFLFLYYTLIMFILLFIIIISNIIPYITIYFTSYYIPEWGIVYISNTITFALILSSFVIFKNFGKDIMCNCNES